MLLVNKVRTLLQHPEAREGGGITTDPLLGHLWLQGKERAGRQEGRGEGRSYPPLSWSGNRTWKGKKEREEKDTSQFRPSHLHAWQFFSSYFLYFPSPRCEAKVGGGLSQCD